MDLLKRQNFRLLKSLLSVGKVAVFLWKNEEDWPVEYVSESIKNLIGYSAEDFLSGKVRYADLIHPDDLERVIDEVKKYSREKPPYWIHQPYRLLRKDNSYIWVWDQTIPVFDNNGEVSHYFGYIVDITHEIEYSRFYKFFSEISKTFILEEESQNIFKILCLSLIRNFDIKTAIISNKDGEIIFLCEQNVECEHLIRAIVKRPDYLKSILENKIYITSIGSQNKLKLVALPVEIQPGETVVINLIGDTYEWNLYQNKGLLTRLHEDLKTILRETQVLKHSILLRKAIENAEEWFIITDSEGNILYANEFISKISGYSLEEIIGKNPRIFKSGLMNPKIYEELWNTIKKGKTFETIFINRKKNGELFYLEAKIVPVKLPDGEVRYISLARDITTEHKLHAELEKIKHFDPLTNLYNKDYFLSEVNRALENISSGILLTIDINDFSFINKKYGIQFGDLLLKEIAGRLKAILDETFIISRTGGDEFSIFMPLSIQDSFLFIIEIEEVLKKPFRIESENIKLLFNMGITVYPTDGKTAEELYQNAFLALNKSLQNGFGLIRFYDKEIEKEIASQLTTKELIEEAIENKNFIFFYQPYYNAWDINEIKGYEALLRIKDSKGNMHYPSEFIEFLEKSPYAVDFRDWALKEAVKTINKIKRSVSINLTALDLRDQKFLSDLIRFSSKLEPESPLVIEITERILFEDIEFSKAILKEIKSLPNIKIAIDDFGTGYSSLSYLIEFMPDIVKLDISFIRQITYNEKVRLLVKHIIEIAKSLNIKTIAEGIETQEQLKILRDFGCDFVQGFLLSRPLPAEKLKLP
ncbi:EAL domain-containing protein [Persephonella sp. KM09-Lau-8]|uniref:bifunctional diguanylate cyclase/phosphodiesterase n=1 Tax=Persephonella sp. KM09-Lau-8 TaxID=1158345 RepID=UPI0018CC3690|nr:EAL domain-containing protein [Persephonella sp. KM09-Lau-8]